MRKSPARTAAMLTVDRVNAQKCTGPSRAAGKARVALNVSSTEGRTGPRRRGKRLLRTSDREGDALYSLSLENVYRWFRAEITAFGTGRRREERRSRHRMIPGGPIKQRPRRGAWRETGGLTNKAGMSFSFMGIMLATPRSVKDSDCGLEAAGRLGVYILRTLRAGCQVGGPCET